MGKVAEKTGYVWVKKIGRGWFPYVELVEQVSMPLGFVVVIVSSLFGFGEMLTMVGAGMIGLSFLLLFPFGYALYNMLVCPQCGHNPMRTSKTHKRIPHRTALRKAADLAECPPVSPMKQGIANHQRIGKDRSAWEVSA